jgi:hypothetical protein
MTRHLYLCALVALFAACTSAPSRISTEAERSRAAAAIELVSSAVAALALDGTIRPEDVPIAQAQLSELSAAVQESATVPVSWNDLRRRLFDIAVAWGVQRVLND